jgi:hypothetical protein
VEAVLTFDFWYKLISLLTSLGIFTAIFKLVKWAITLEPRIQRIETQGQQYGAMIQQFTNSMAHIEGIIEAFKEWNGIERRRKEDEI